MDDIKKDIIQVYKVVGDPSALEGKETIEILQVSFNKPFLITFYYFLGN
jgi:hypothetical protein